MIHFITTAKYNYCDEFSANMEDRKQQKYVSDFSVFSILKQQKLVSHRVTALRIRSILNFIAFIWMDILFFYENKKN